MRSFALIATIAVATLTAAPALAGQEDAQSRTVHVADLDLGSAQGQAALRYRIARAVEGVCGSYASATSVAAEDQIAACRASATAGIRQQIASHKTPIVQTAAIAR